MKNQGNASRVVQVKLGKGGEANFEVWGRKVGGVKEGKYKCGRFDRLN